ncbi:MAG TPA: glycosyltransferase family 4 protein [Micromonosporaceae bacterium]|nr:glycosyltransferase family 4 protein [Micromonosporaceae bacterium]
MDILFVSHSADLLGAERSLLAVVREAVRVGGHRVTVALPADGPLRTELVAVGASVVMLPTRLWMGHRHNRLVGSIRLLQAAWSLGRYRRYLARTRPDLVVTNSVVIPVGAVAARLARIPHVWVVRESLASNPNLRSVLPRSAIARSVGHLAHGIIVISEYVAGQLVRAAPSAGPKVQVIPPAITPWPGAGAATPRHAGSGPERVVMLGRYTSEKGQADAITALGICARAGRPFQLRLAGLGGPDACRAASELATAHGVADLVETTEWTDDPQALYRWADATLMLSRNEAYGRVTVESLMAGTPVIAFRAGASAEILAGGGGVLVEPRADALARAMLELAADAAAFDRLRIDAVRRGREFRAAPSSAAAFVTYLERLYRDNPPLCPSLGRHR